MPLLPNQEELVAAANRMKMSLSRDIEAQTCKLRDIQQQLADIEGFLNTLQRLEASTVESCHNEVVTSGTRHVENAGESMRDKVERIVEQMLAETSVVRTAEVLERLGDLGIKIGGKDPKANVAAILCKSAKFVNSRVDRGWKLRAGGSV